MKTQTINVKSGETFKVNGKHLGTNVEGPAVIVILTQATEETVTCVGGTD